MSDFTKEELEEIVDMMHFARKQGIETTHNLSYEVELKAKFMIDNYCDHPGDDRLEGNLCSKCGDKVNIT